MGLQFACVLLCVTLASSGCRKLEFDNLRVHHKFVNAGHSFPPGILYCDFKDIGNLANMVATHDREGIAIIVVHGS